jgi:dipeptidyl aminopeptidase/acylaminoacyl peptidase
MKMRQILSLKIVLLLGWVAITCRAQSMGATLDGLQAMTDEGGFALAHVRENRSSEGIRREVRSFEVDGLTQYALVLWPAGEAPDDGWPVVQFNHGYHPNPPRNGYNNAGESDRPGDYYRETVQSFASAGYAVVVPDYRGHNISEGAEYTSRMLADAWYSRDAVACFLALESVPGLDMGRAYMLGHSMGGPITLRAMLALGDRVKAGAVWSTSAADKLSQFMGEALKASGGVDSSAHSKAAMDSLVRELKALGPGVTLEDLAPIARAAQLQAPLSIQHALGDQSATVTSSLELAGRLYTEGRRYQLKVYSANDHLFSGDNFTAAVARDIAWFERYR